MTLEALGAGAEVFAPLGETSPPRHNRQTFDRPASDRRRLDLFRKAYRQRGDGFDQISSGRAVDLVSEEMAVECRGLYGVLACPADNDLEIGIIKQQLGRQRSRFRGERINRSGRGSRRRALAFDAPWLSRRSAE
jgi:hypothetical protein